jgi:hypothetical protein
VNDGILYQEIWPRGRMMHLRLTDDTFTASIYKSFWLLRRIPTAGIRHVEIVRLGFSTMMAISYYKTTTVFITSSFAIRDKDAWRRTFQSIGIIVD